MSFLDIFTGNAATDAARAQTASLNRAEGVQRENRARLEDIYNPYVDRGSRATNALADIAGLNGNVAANNALANFRTSPGYQNTFDTAMRGVENSAAARGDLLSGGTLATLRDTAGTLESNQFQNHLALLAGLGQGGLSAAGGLASGLTSNANALANLNVAAGNARAAGLINRQNVQNSAFQGGMNILASGLGYGAGGGVNALAKMFNTGGGGRSAFDNTAYSSKGYKDFYAS